MYVYLAQFSQIVRWLHYRKQKMCPPRIHEQPQKLYIHYIITYMDVSKNRATPKWMVKIMGNPIKMDDLEVLPLFLETPIYHYKFTCLEFHFRPAKDSKSNQHQRSRKIINFPSGWSVEPM